MKSVISVAIVVCCVLVSSCDRTAKLSDRQHLEKAKTYWAQSKTEEAIIELKNAVQKNPNNGEARLLLGEIYLKEGFGQEAQKSLERAQELGVKDSRIKFLIGRAQLVQGRYQGILSNFPVDANENAAARARVLYVRGEALIGLRKPEEGCPAFDEAVSLDPEFVDAYLGRAKCAFGYGKVDEARAQLNLALGVDKSNLAVWKWLGDLEHSQSHLEQALSAYTRAIELSPSDVGALLGRASVLSHGAQVGDANKDVDAALKLRKDDPQALFLQGVLLYKSNKLPDAKTSFEHALRVAPNYQAAALWLGLTCFALNNFEQAAKRFGQYLSDYPDNNRVQALLGLTQARLGNRQAAEEALKTLGNVKFDDPQGLTVLGQTHLMLGEVEKSARYFASALEKNPDSIGSRLQLATALLQTGETQAATAQLRQVLDNDPNNQQAESMLISSYMKGRQFDNAMKYIADLETRDSSSPLPHAYRAQVLMLQQQVEAAKGELRTALQKDPGNPLAGGLLANYEQQLGKVKEARAVYEDVLKHNPNHLDTMIALAQLEMATGSTEQAKQVLERALNKHPTAPIPARLLATGYVVAQNPGKALEVSNDAAMANPNDVELSQVRGAAFLARGDQLNALSEFTKIVKLRPDLPEGHFKLALTLAATNDVPGARKELQETLKFDSKHFGAKLMLAQLALRDQEHETATRLSRELQQEHPELVDGSIVESEVLSRQGRNGEALKVLERGLKAHPDSNKVVLQMSRVHLVSGESTTGIRILEDWRSRHPEDAAVAALLGEQYLGAGAEAKAAKIFEVLLRNEPTSLSALNNLALALRKSNPARAAELAERANVEHPNNAGVLDTLGWILAGQGKSDRALELIEKAHRLAPSVAEIHYHYAAVLAQRGSKDAARREITRVLDSGSTFGELEDAKRLARNLAMNS